MSSSASIAATLPPETRQQIVIEVLAKSQPISHLAAEHEPIPLIQEIILRTVYSSINGRTFRRLE